MRASASTASAGSWARTSRASSAPGGAKQVVELDAELLQHAIHPRLDHDARPARERQLPRDPEPLVDRRREREIAQLAGPAEIGHRGQERALHHRPEQHVGREPVRLLGGDPLDGRQVESLPASAGDESAAVLHQPVAPEAPPRP